MQIPRKFLCPSLLLLCSCPGFSKPSAERTLRPITKQPSPKIPVRVTPSLLHGKIAYIQSSDVWIADARGHVRRRIFINPFGGANSPSDIAFSPDLTQVVFTYDPPWDSPFKGNMLFSMRIDGTNRQVLVGMQTGSEFGQPRFSPDGRKILYTRRTGKHMGGPMTADADIWIINIDGSDNHRLIGDYNNSDAAHYEARWSRDGKRVGFLRTVGDLPENPEVPHSTPVLMSVGLDGKNAQLAKGQESHFLLDGVSPDGKKRVVHVQNDDVTGQLFIQDLIGKISCRLTGRTGMRESNGHFSPDGMHIVFDGTRWRRLEDKHSHLPVIWVVDADGSNLRRLVEGGSSNLSCIAWLK